MWWDFQKVLVDLGGHVLLLSVGHVLLNPRGAFENLNPCALVLCLITVCFLISLVFILLTF